MHLPSPRKARGPLPRSRGALAPLLALLLLLPLVLALPGPAAAQDGDDAPTPTPGLPWFGPQLDWETDSADDYRARLGSTASLYGQRVAYPLTPDSTFFLRRLVRQSAAQGAVPVLSLEPSLPLDELTEEHAAELAEELASLHDELGTTYLLRFAPEMNGSWYSWAQQPTAYVDAFRLLADVVHAQSPSAAMVWSPVYGAGYPYGAAYGDVDPDREADVDALDTDGNGRLDSGDDPYGPFWPGEDVVDWVGLTLYHFGPDRGRIDNDLDDPVGGGATGDEETSTGFETDVAPRKGAFRARLEERYGYGTGGGRRPFYDRFAERFDKPLLVDTGVVWLPDPEGDPEQRIKRAWWRQVLRADRDWPLIGGIFWVEERRREAEVRDRVVDWRATRTPRLARALLSDLEGEVDLGPVTPPATVSEEPDPDEAGEPAPPGVEPAEALPATAVLPLPTALGLALGAGSLLLLLVLAWAARRARPAWGYDVATDHVEGRDARLDLARGVLLLGLVAAHVELLATTEGPLAHLMGALVGPEAFVLVAGLAVGLRHDVLTDQAGAIAAASARWRVALRYWFVAVLAALVVLGLRYLPGDATAAVTHWLPGPGGLDLYARSAPLLEYPPPWWAVRELFELRTLPWPLAMLGLMVVLSLIAPLVVMALRAGLWWAVLPLSWTAYAAGLIWSPDPTMGAWEAAYPPLLWQAVFVHAVVLAHHRHDLAARLGTRGGRIASAVLALVATGWCAVTAWALVAGGEPASRLVDLTDGRDLPAGRLLVLALAAAVAWLVLTACWRPVRTALGGVLLPVGRAATTLLVVHVLLLVAVSAVPGLDLARGPVALGAGVLVLVVVVLAARSSRLRAVIPG